MTTGDWGSGSLAIIVPLDGPAAPDWDRADRGLTTLSRQYPWSLTMLGRGSAIMPAQAPPTRPITDTRVRAALAPAASDYHVWIAKPGDYMGRFWTALVGDWDLYDGALVTAVEYLRHREPVDAAAVVVHVQLVGDALADPAAAAAFFARPTSGLEEADLGWFGSRTGSRRRLDHRVLDSLLHELGILAERRYQPHRPPFVVSHLVPAGDRFGDRVPTPDLAAHTSVGWRPEQLWAARMAGSSNLDLAREPGLDPVTACVGGFWLGTTWVLPTAHGLSFVATRGVGSHPVETEEGTLSWTNRDGMRPTADHVATAELAHRHAVDLALLGLRQEAFLREHAERLPQVLNPVSQRRRLDLAQDAQASLLAFRSRFWLTRIPGHPEASRVLVAVQSALDLPTLYDEVAREQDETGRALSIATELAREDERDRDAAHGARLESSVAVLGAVLAVAGVVFGMAQLTGEEGWSYAWVVTLAAVLLSPALFMLVLLVRSRRGGSEPAPSSPSQHLVAETASAGPALEEFARTADVSVRECRDGWFSETDRSRTADARVHDVRVAVRSVGGDELQRLWRRFADHPAGSTCSCAGFPVGLAAVAWNPHAPREVWQLVLSRPDLLGDPVADDHLAAGVLAAHCDELDRDTLWSLFHASLPSTSRPQTTAAVMRLPHLDAIAQGELWDGARDGGPGGVWQAGVSALAAGVAGNAQANAAFVAKVAGDLWSGAAAARLDLPPEPFLGSAPVTMPGRTLHEVLHARLAAEAGVTPETRSLEDLVTEFADGPDES